MHDFSLFAMFKQGWPVLCILLTMSVFSLAIFIDRLCAFRRIRCDILPFIRHVIRIAGERDRDTARTYCNKYRYPVALAAQAVFDAHGNREAREDAMSHAIESEVHRLEVGIAAIGTIASLAPFVGLFGTVVGIIKAFNSIAANSGGGTDVVAAGIAEALVTTACGLLVAIPAVAFYNYCANRIKRVACETELAVYELVVWLSEHEAGSQQPSRSPAEYRAPASRY
jgi:biopolymer transport protein ExbB/TolQ